MNISQICAQNRTDLQFYSLQYIRRNVYVSQEIIQSLTPRPMYSLSLVIISVTL